MTDDLEAKRLGLLHSLLPQAAAVGFLTNPRFASADSQLHDVQQAARALGLNIRVLPASTEPETVLWKRSQDAVRLWALGLGARVIDVLDCEIQLVLVPFGIATELAAAVGQWAQQLDIMLLEERQHTVIEQICGRDGRLAVVELGKAYLGVGVDEDLLVDASNALQIADIERILRAAISWMLALELAKPRI